jgi:hypothetical protein
LLKVEQPQQLEVVVQVCCPQQVMQRWQLWLAAELTMDLQQGVLKQEQEQQLRGPLEQKLLLLKVWQLVAGLGRVLYLTQVWPVLQQPLRPCCHLSLQTAFQRTLAFFQAH